MIKVEMLDERPLSYMSVETKMSLQMIHQLGWFIPVTTRTTAQYERITFFQQELKPEYAVTTNGGCILHHGKPLEDWQVIVDEAQSVYVSQRDAKSHLRTASCGMGEAYPDSRGKISLFDYER
ncbi:hypothetical protein ACEQPO_01615 [Bacillus sp. SL00103]